MNSPHPMILQANPMIATAKVASTTSRTNTNQPFLTTGLSSAEPRGHRRRQELKRTPARSVRNHCSHSWFATQRSATTVKPLLCTMARAHSTWRCTASLFVGDYHGTSDNTPQA